MIEQRAVVRGRAGRPYRALDERTVIEREGDDDFACGEPLAAQRVAERGERPLHHEQQRLGAGDGVAEFAGHGRQRIVARGAGPALVETPCQAVRGEAVRSEARLDLGGVQGGELADGRETEGGQRSGEIVVEREQADRIRREEGRIAAAGDRGGKAVGRSGDR